MMDRLHPLNNLIPVHVYGYMHVFLANVYSFYMQLGDQHFKPVPTTGGLVNSDCTTLSADKSATTGIYSGTSDQGTSE